jgi:hypothetical protein
MCLCEMGRGGGLWCVQQNHELGRGPGIRSAVLCGVNQEGLHEEGGPKGCNRYMVTEHRMHSSYEHASSIPGLRNIAPLGFQAGTCSAAGWDDSTTGLALSKASWPRLVRVLLDPPRLWPI